MISVINIKDNQIKRLKALSTPKLGFHYYNIPYGPQEPYDRVAPKFLRAINLGQPVQLPKHQPLRNAISAGTADFDGVLPIYEKTKDQFEMIMDSLQVEFSTILT